MSGGGGGSRVPIPNNVRKIIQDIREITVKQHTDDEIYAVLRECSMDPNETAQKLLYLGFHSHPIFNFYIYCFLIDTKLRVVARGSLDYVFYFFSIFYCSMFGNKVEDKKIAIYKYCGEIKPNRIGFSDLSRV